VAEPADAADSKGALTSEDHAATGNRAGPSDEQPRGEAPSGQSAGNQESVDFIEAALADALRRAAEAGAFDAVVALTNELKSRREARAGAVSLEAARRKRDGRA